LSFIFLNTICQFLKPTNRSGVNNDSLNYALNKDNQGSAKIVGIPIDTLINLKSAATKYKIKEGTVWLYKIESKTAVSLSIKIKQFYIPEGAYICLFPNEKRMQMLGRKVSQKKDIKTSDFWDYNYGNQLYVEYFEPNKVDKKVNIFISRIGYGFRF